MKKILIAGVGILALYFIFKPKKGTNKTAIGPSTPTIPGQNSKYPFMSCPMQRQWPYRNS